MRSKMVHLGIVICLSVNSSAVADDELKTEDQIQPVVTFYAMGDVPYAPAEDALLPQQIADLPDDGEFVIHVGDIKSGRTLCSEAVYIKVSDMLSKSQTPVFIIPGDNEWNDCLIPTQAWEFWNKYFMRLDQRWHHRLPVFRQIEHEENFSFVKGDVLFVGANIVGGLVRDPSEWTQRHSDDLDWISGNLRRFGADVTSLVVFGHAKPAKVHNDFFDPFSKVADEFKKPILYLHGDGHKWIHDRPFAAKNILRVEVDQGGIAPPLKVTVTKDPNTPFQFDRRNGKSPVEPAPAKP